MRWNLCERHLRIRMEPHLKEDRYSRRLGPSCASQQHLLQLPHKKVLMLIANYTICFTIQIFTSIPYVNGWGCAQCSTKKERKMLSSVWIVVLLHPRLDLSLYVIPKRKRKRASRLLEAPRKVLPPFKGEHREWAWTSRLLHCRWFNLEFKSSTRFFTEMIEDEHNVA